MIMENELMGEFLIELKDLLDKYRVTILRSAEEKHRIVVSLHDKNSGTFIETEFDDDVCVEAIEHHWYGPATVNPNFPANNGINHGKISC